VQAVRRDVLVGELRVDVHECRALPVGDADERLVEGHDLAGREGAASALHLPGNGRQQYRQAAALRRPDQILDGIGRGADRGAAVQVVHARHDDDDLRHKQADEIHQP
jgi:hypothetical protein